MSFPSLGNPGLPLAVSPISQLVGHLTSTPVHATYFPYLRFGLLHAIRVSTVWAAMTKGRKGRVGILQDLVGFLTVAWGGGTIVSLLLNQPPSWIILTPPWIIYPLVFLLLIPTGLSTYIIDTCPSLLFNIIAAYVDGILRGTTIAAVPAILPNGGNWLSMTLLSGTAVCGGGWLVSGFGLNQAEWTVGVPTVLQGGLLNTLDFWGGMIAGVIYAALLRLYPEFDGISTALHTVLPGELHAVGAASAKTAVTSQDTARAVTVLVYGSLLCARVITKAVMDRRSGGTASTRTASKIRSMKTEKSPELDQTAKTEVVKTPIRERQATPRKSPKPKKQ